MIELGLVSRKIEDAVYSEGIEELKSEIDRMKDIPLTHIAGPLARHFLEEFREHPFLKRVVISLSFPAYAGLSFIGVLTTYASINLLYNAHYSYALSTNPAVRVNFANNITNAGALFACITDFPFISYVLYSNILQKSHSKAALEVMNENYQKLDIPPEMREELYQRHILNLQKLGLDRFYQNPDLKSETGAIYAKLGPILNEIDQEIEEGRSACELLKRCLKEFRSASCSAKLEKMTAGAIASGFWLLSSFIMLENAILIKDTPVIDLFDGDAAAQDAEAFYLTQLGGFFASLTAFIAAGYIFYYAFAHASFTKAKCEKINAAFAKHIPVSDEREALKHILEKKILKLS